MTSIRIKLDLVGSLQQRHCSNLIHQPFLEPIRLSPKICFPLPNLFNPERKSSPKNVEKRSISKITPKITPKPGYKPPFGHNPKQPLEKNAPHPAAGASRASLLSRLSKKVTARPGTPARPVRPMRWMWSSGPGDGWDTP